MGPRPLPPTEEGPAPPPPLKPAPPPDPGVPASPPSPRPYPHLPAARPTPSPHPASALSSQTPGPPGPPILRSRALPAPGLRRVLALHSPCPNLALPRPQPRFAVPFSLWTPASLHGHGALGGDQEWVRSPGCVTGPGVGPAFEPVCGSVRRAPGGCSDEPLVPPPSPWTRWTLSGP